MGLLESDVAYDFVKSALTLMSDPDLERLNRAFAQLEERTHELAGTGELTLRRSFEIRFTHQSVRLRVGIPDGPVDRAVIEEAEARFRRDYFGLTGISPTDSCTILNCWLDAVGGVAKPALKTSHASRPAGEALKGERQAFFPGEGFLDTPVYDREALAAEAVLQGPALLEEPESTTLLPPGFTMATDAFGNAVIERAR
jgi:N-methylhydantoinase A